MEVILLERVAKLGQMGEVVRVKDGYARNFLLPRGKALRATKDNRAQFEGMKADLEARNLEAKGEADKVAEKIDGRNVIVVRQASETGQLFGSVSSRDLVGLFEADGVSVNRSQILLDPPIKTIGQHKIAVAVHPEVEVSVTVTVARSADEAERIARGEDVTARNDGSRRGRRSSGRRRRVLRAGRWRSRGRQSRKTLRPTTPSKTELNADQKQRRRRVHPAPFSYRARASATSAASERLRCRRTPAVRPVAGGAGVVAAGAACPSDADGAAGSGRGTITITGPEASGRGVPDAGGAEAAGGVD